MIRKSVILAASAVVTFYLQAAVARADPTEVTRGKYLVQLAGCGHCHTPGHFLGKPDPTRVLGGSDVGFRVPGGSAVIGPNLTPDKKTGLGNWTTEQIINALQHGIRPDGRVLSPVMPYADYVSLTAADAQAIAAYLQTLPAVRHKVPRQTDPKDKTVTITWTLLPPEVAAATAVTDTRKGSR